MSTSVFGKKRRQTNPFWNFERKSPRCPISMFARDQRNDWFVSGPGDISMGGFRIETDEPFEPGTTIDLFLRLPDTGTWIQGTGEVLATTGTEKKLDVRGRLVRMKIEDQYALAHWLHDTSVGTGRGN